MEALLPGCVLEEVERSTATHSIYRYCYHEIVVTKHKSWPGFCHNVDEGSAQGCQLNVCIASHVALNKLILCSTYGLTGKIILV